jgi:hypothetical protein
MALSSAQRKFLRGVEQVKTLREEADAFKDDDAYVFSKEFEARTPQHRVYRCYATERQPVPDHWPLLAGEAIQNIRASLDHVVYAHSGRDDSAFPICTGSTNFARRSAQTLKGVPASVRATIKRAQPYIATPTAPSQDLLELLRTFSNIDKHRALTTVASAVQNEWIGINEGIKIAWSEMATNKVLTSGKTQISAFTVIAEREIRDVDVQPHFSYQVRIEGRPLDMLVSIAKHVFPILIECETGKPLSPFAPYPI